MSDKITNDAAAFIRTIAENWKAESVAGNIDPGIKVQVISVQNWKLYVGQLTNP